MGMVKEEKFRFCIDRGGTFTDIYAEVPGQSNYHVMKLLSVDPLNYDDAPTEGIRRILEGYTGEKIPRSAKIPTDKIEWIRMGTTVATNALLERKGERIALCVTKGFRDLLQIGNQARPNIFDLTVSKPSNLYEDVIEVNERVETSKPLIGFDMGGTSTDVSRYNGCYEHVLETEIAGAIIQAPQLDINTVAAGGGSKLKFQFGAFKVGPESVGAHPGPVCYRKGGQLAVTDANLILRKVIPDYFPAIFGPNEDEPLDIESTRKEFEKLATNVNNYRKSQDPSAKEMTVEEIALGFINVANETMCRPIRQLTEMKGHETKNHALACFGGAGPQHACSITRSLGMSEVLIHRFYGILSAYGMGLADVVEEAQEPYSSTYGPDSVAEATRREVTLLMQVKQKLQHQGFDDECIVTESYLNLRYEGTDTAIMLKRLKKGLDNDYAGEFVMLFQQEYGFKLPNRNKVFICVLRGSDF